MRRSERTPADIGLQPERTELSWRRTLLALAVASVASTRALYPLLGDGAVVLGLTGLTIAGGLAIATRHRFARMHAWFSDRVRGSATARPRAAFSGRALLTMSAFISAGCGLLLIQLVLIR